MFGYFVNKWTAALLVCLLLLPALARAQRKPVYSPAKSRDTADLQAPLLNPCAELKARREESAAKTLILGEAALADANQNNYDVRYYGINLSIDFGIQ